LCNMHMLKHCLLPPQCGATCFSSCGHSHTK
jgi:hypothetical protein